MAGKHSASYITANVIGASWLVMFYFPVTAALELESSAARNTCLVIIVVFGINYLLGMADTAIYRGKLETRFRARAVAHVIIAFVLAVPILYFIDLDGLSLLNNVTALAIFLLPGTWGPWIGLALGAYIYWTVVSHGEVMDRLFLLLMTMLVYVAILLGLYFTQLISRAHNLNRRTAILDERERVARDVHDVLGHSLTLIALKSELAKKLVSRDPAAAEAEIDEISELTRHAISEVRHTVAGIRVGKLEDELATCRKACADAGLAVKVRGEVEAVSPRHSILFAWVLREATTNVIRHAQASTLTIILNTDSISVSDDGKGFDPHSASGNGIRGLRERVETDGGQLTVVSSRSGTTITARAGFSEAH